MANTPFTVQALVGTLDPATWVPIAPPVDCDHVVVSNKYGASILRLRTSAASVATEIPVGVGAEQSIAIPRRQHASDQSGVSWRFPSGATVFSLKPDSGTGTGMLLVWA